MLAEAESRPRFRESRIYGYEIKHGPRGLEATVARSEGVKNVEILVGPRNLGTVFMQAQKRMNAGPQQKLIVSVWVSFPFVYADPADTDASLSAHKSRFIRVHRAIRRLIRRKAYQFFEGQNHGA